MSLLKVNEITDLGGDVPDGVGKILQVVSATKTDTFSTSSTSFTDVTGLSVSITPLSSSSKILVSYQVQTGMVAATTAQTMLRLMRGSTAIAVGDAAGSRTQATTGMTANEAFTMESNAASFLDAPNSTSALTYKVQQRVTASTGFVNRTDTDSDQAAFSRSVSTITLMEVAG